MSASGLREPPRLFDTQVAWASARTGVLRGRSRTCSTACSESARARHIMQTTGSDVPCPPRSSRMPQQTSSTCQRSAEYSASALRRLVAPRSCATPHSRRFDPSQSRHCHWRWRAFATPGSSNLRARRHCTGSSNGTMPSQQLIKSAHTGRRLAGHRRFACRARSTNCRAIRACPAASCRSTARRGAREIGRAADRRAPPITS